MPFLGEASHTYFFRRKVSASRILQVPGALILGFFQKLFAVCASQMGQDIKEVCAEYLFMQQCLCQCVPE